MAKVKCKELYIAKSMSELNEKCSYEFDKNKGIKAHLTLVNKTFQAADVAYADHDEERSYILFMRYLDATTKVRKSKEFQKQADHYSTLFGNTKSVTAIEKAEKLSESLKKRYRKIEDSQKHKLHEESTKDVTTSVNGCKETKLEYSFPTELVTSQELYQLIYKDKKSVLLMDVRSVDDYENSHFIHQSSINVPNDAISPGSVTTKIEKGIPLSFIKLWNARDTADVVVLIDWHSNIKRLQDKADPLCSLKDSLYKWEQNKELKRSPVVLEGGYAEWLESFPQFTSNPQVTPPDNQPKTSNVNSMLDFNYSDLKKEFQPFQNKVLEESKFAEGSVVENNAKPSSNQNFASNHFDITEPSLPPTDNSIKSGLYPKIDKTFSSPKVTTQANSKPLIEENVTTSKVLPTFDRSTKPKPLSAKVVPASNHTTLTDDQLSHPALTHPTPAKIDRSIKPTVVGKPSSITKQVPSDDDFDEINKLEQNILKIKRETEEKERRVQEIEKKKKLAELQAYQRKLEQGAQELKQRELQAENDLAATMRNISKPSDTGVAVESKRHVPSSQELKPSPTTEKISPKNINSGVPLTEILEKQLSKEMKATSNLTSTKTPEINCSSASSTISSLKPLTNQTTSLPLPHTVNEKSDLAVELTNAVVPDNSTSTTMQNTGLKPSKVKPENVPHPVTPGIPPPTYASVKKAGNSETNLVVPLNIPKPDYIPANKNIHHAPLKDEPDNQSFGLKRSFSSPNIAKMVQEETTEPQIPHIPSRQNKPESSPPRNLVQIPSRDTKPAYQEESDQIASQMNLSLRGVYGGEGRGICGLRNLGNSCYMNSVLQCMFNTTQLAEYILTNSYRKDINKNNILGHGGRVAECFAVLLRAVWSGQYKYLIPSDMKQIAGSINPIFGGYSQEDSHELLLMLLDGLHEDLNRVVTFKYEEEPDNDDMTDDDAAKEAWKYHKKRNESIIVELFTGQFKATVCCLSCGKTSRKFDAFRFLTLSLPSRSASIYDLVRDFSKQERMTGSDKWKCPNCKVLREAVRTIAIWKLPPMLIIHLKRFVHTGRWRDKIHTNINFPTTGLDLQKYTGGPQKRRSYDLFAVSHHHGAGLDSGHYTATCRSVLDNKWYKFDDTEAYPTSTPLDSTAFILFYSAYPRQVPRHTAFQ